MKSNSRFKLDMEATSTESLGTGTKPVDEPKLRLVFTAEQLKILGYQSQIVEETNTDGNYEAR